MLKGGAIAAPSGSRRRQPAAVDGLPLHELPRHQRRVAHLRVDGHSGKIDVTVCSLEHPEQAPPVHPAARPCKSR